MEVKTCTSVRLQVCINGAAGETVSKGPESAPSNGCSSACWFHSRTIRHPSHFPSLHLHPLHLAIAEPITCEPLLVTCAICGVSGELAGMRRKSAATYVALEVERSNENIAG